MTTRMSSLALGVTFAWCCAAQAQEPSLAASLGLVVFPSEGQTAEAQNADEAACYQWARQATGVDPMQPAAAPPAPAPQQSGGAGRTAGGALRGAAGAALIADIADADTNEAAWAGAVVGGARGAREHRVRSQQSEMQADADAQAQAARTRETFNRGFAACMEGKRYTVK